MSVTHPEAEADLLETAEQAIEIFAELGDDLGLARAWRRISVVRRLRCRFESAAEAARTGLIHARRAGAAQEEARLVDEICSALLFGPAPVDDAIARSEQLLAESGKSRMTEANVSSSLAGLRAMRGDFDEARVCIAASRKVYADLGLRFAIAGLAQISGSVELLAGDPEAAERELLAGYEILSEVGARGLLAAELARALVAQGRYDEAADYALVAEEASGGGDLAPQVLWRGAQARISGDPELAEEAVQLALQTDALPLIADAQLQVAVVLEALGRDAEAQDAAERAARTYASKGHSVGEGAAAALSGVWSARRAT